MGSASTATPDRTAASVSADAVLRLVYRSRSRSRIEPARSGLAMSDILGVARSKNTAWGITGALMLYQDWFAQVLEGDEARVRALFATIRADGRHGSVHGDRVARQGAPDLPTLGDGLRGRARPAGRTAGGHTHGARPRLLPGG